MPSPSRLNAQVAQIPPPPAGFSPPRAQTVLAPGDLALGPVPLGLHLEGRFWLTIGESGYAGEGRVALLEAIDREGSLNKAAKALGLSYKSAWDALQFLNNAAGVPLVTASTGGRGGGGSQLTSSGRWLVEVFNRVKSVHRQFLDALAAAVVRSTAAGEGAGAPGALERLFLRTSARNQWLGRVVALHQEGISVLVEVDLGGPRLHARLTAASVSELGLEPGMSVWALVKAQAVRLAAPDEIVTGDARAHNRLSGRVLPAPPVDGDGSVDSDELEVALALDGGNTVHAVLPWARAEALGVSERAEERELLAVFDPAQVILGVLA